MTSIPSPESPRAPAGGPLDRSGWRVTVTHGPASALHDREIPAEPAHEIWIHHVTGPALVIGSTQPEAVVDRPRAETDGVEVCRRRSGGGIVALVPGDACWVDAVVPRWSALWDDDVGRAFGWLGRAWAAALRGAVTDLAAPATEPLVHDGPLAGGPAGRLVCFASLGPGEVTAGGRKLVGISQRRLARAARFQSVALGRWDGGLLARYVDAAAVAAAGLDLPTLPAGLAPGAAATWPEPASLARALVDALPAVAGRPGADPDGVVTPA